MSRKRWAAVAVVVLAVGCSSGGGDGDGEAGRSGEIVELNQTVVGPGGLASALELELSASLLSTVGLAGIEVESDLAELRQATDEDLAAVGRADDREIYPSSEATAETLAALRRDVDAAAGPRASIDQHDLAHGFFERYRAIVDQYGTAGREALVDLVDDPGFREGLELQFLASDVSGREREIVFRIFGVTLGEARGSPEDIAELSRLATEQRADVETLLATSEEPYRRVIESSGLEEHHEAMAVHVDRVLNGEPISAVEVLETAGGESPESHPFTQLRLGLVEAVEAEAG